MQPDLAKALVESGPFQFSRNPMYLGMMLILIGAFLGFGAWVNLIWVGVFFAVISVFQIGPEERALRDKFGVAYEAYCQRVRRWI